MADTSLKYADKLSPEHKVAMEMVVGTYHTLKIVETQLRKVDDAERQSHSSGHIVDPTLYRDQISSKNFASQMVIIRAALAFIDAIDALKSEMVEAE